MLVTIHRHIIDKEILEKLSFFTRARTLDLFFPVSLKENYPAFIFFSPWLGAQLAEIMSWDGKQHALYCEKNKWSKVRTGSSCEGNFSWTPTCDRRQDVPMVVGLSWQIWLKCTKQVMKRCLISNYMIVHSPKRAFPNTLQWKIVISCADCQPDLSSPENFS